MTQAVRVEQLCFQGSFSEGFAVYLILPQKMPFAADRSLVLYIEMHDSNRQRGAAGLTIGKGRGFEESFGAHLTR